MNDTELDQRLAEVAGVTNDIRMHETLVRLGRDAAVEIQSGSSSRQTQSPRPRRHRGWGVAAAVAGAAVLLTAGTTAAAYYLGIPPFQSLDEGALRTTQSIPMHYTARNGVEIKCRIFLEFMNVPSTQVMEVDDAIKDHDWTGFGQRLYDAQPNLPPAPPLSVSLSPQDPVEAAEVPAVFAFAKSVLPEIHLFGAGGPDAPQLSGIGESCVPSAQ
jgi:hypothetical protein